eukprot:1417728-Rhodomonas_salina.1
MAGGDVEYGSINVPRVERRRNHASSTQAVGFSRSNFQTAVSSVHGKWAAVGWGKEVLWTGPRILVCF